MFINYVTPRFGNIDGLKHVNNIVVAEWFEIGRNEIFRFFTPDLNLSYDKWKLIMVRTEFDYVSQMYFGHDVEIRTYLLKIGNTSFTFGHEAWQNEELKAKGKAIIVHYDFIEKKSKPIPNEIREKLISHLIDEAEIGKSLEK
ncbi:MAG: acyl-CoA thioesterase [Methanobacteriaceae archaeon]|jgi:acyl-CoA thioester hydrolase|nr:acyl-CoA thioesterase [Candidatus Methanorudis spinitermitis]